MLTSVDHMRVTRSEFHGILNATNPALVVSDGHKIDVTISAGLAVGPADSVTKVIEFADDCLYQAKAAGRNRIVSAAADPGVS